MSKRVVLTVSGVIAADIREQIASGKRPAVTLRDPHVEGFRTLCWPKDDIHDF